MKNDKIVTINGQKYDSATGLPIEESSKNKPVETKNNIHNIHSLTHRSNKLRTQKNISDIKSHTRNNSRSMDISRSNNVSHFAPRNTSSSIKPPVTKKRMDLEPIKHHSVNKTAIKSSGTKNLSIATKSNKSVNEDKKESIIDAPFKKNIKQKNNIFKRKTKLLNIFSISIVLLIILGYLTYLNIPSISVRIASAQAGIKATYPEYNPDGYSINGPILYNDGEVTINYRANSGKSIFVIKQSKSSWDSSAVKIQADKKSNNETSESKESGLTIYTYNNNTNAIWVNGGILYTISGDAKLSGEQIRHIATSL